MDGVHAQKIISFLGSWKCNRISEHLLHEIGSHSSKIPGSRTKLQVSKAGIRLVALDGSGQPGKSTLIPTSNILNVTINRFKPECLLCVVKDELKKLSVLVCRCKSEKDIVEIIKAFNDVKKSQTGEGYNTNIRKFSGENWSLNTRSKDDSIQHSKQTSGGILIQTTKVDLDNHQNGNYLNDSGTSVTFYDNKGKGFADIAVQTELDEDLDSASTMSSASVKAELLHLSQDVREIKRMLEMSGISDTEHFKRTTANIPNGRQVQYKQVPITREVLRSAEGKPQSDQVIVKGKSTRIVPDHDIRSFAVQTENKNRKVSQENPQTEVSAFSYGDAGYPQGSDSRGYPSARVSSSSQDSSQRYRFGSDSTVTSDVVFLQYPRSPDTIDIHDRVGKVSQFITPPPEIRSKSLQVKRRSDRESRPSVAILSSTVPRPIENVYSGKRYRKRSEHKGRVVITPKTFMNGDVFRRSSENEHRKSSDTSSENRKSSERENKVTHHEKNYEIRKRAFIASTDQKDKSTEIETNQPEMALDKKMDNGDDISSQRSSQNTVTEEKTVFNGSDNQESTVSRPDEFVLLDNAELEPDTSSIEAVIGHDDSHSSGDVTPTDNTDLEVTTPEGVRAIDQVLDF